jgi:hypothetical protein
MDLLQDYLHGITGLLDHMRDYVCDFIAVCQTSGQPCEQIWGLPDGRLAIATHAKKLSEDANKWEFIKSRNEQSVPDPTKNRVSIVLTPQGMEPAAKRRKM